MKSITDVDIASCRGRLKHYLIERLVALGIRRFAFVVERLVAVGQIRRQLLAAFNVHVAEDEKLLRRRRMIGNPFSRCRELILSAVSAEDACALGQMNRHQNELHLVIPGPKTKGIRHAIKDWIVNQLWRYKPERQVRRPF